MPVNACPSVEDRLPCCPLSKVRAGTSVRIKQLLASPDVCQRLRELGMCEEQSIRCVLRSHSVVCQVCNMRLGLSSELADSIWVEPLQPAQRVA
jgi:ferrous iron transport protein A